MVADKRAPAQGRPWRTAFKLFMRLAGGAHAWVYRRTGGAVLGSLRGSPMVLLETVGRKSGKPRTSPLLALRDGEDLVIVASAGGSPGHPGWYHNLEANPEAVVQVGRKRLRVRAEVARGAERERLWGRLVELYPDYARYQRATSREIPVITLHPARG
jgi:deazaflavin-dependent oxidoreductase (nitroreductase family)